MVCSLAKEEGLDIGVGVDAKHGGALAPVCRASWRHGAVEGVAAHGRGMFVA